MNLLDVHNGGTDGTAGAGAFGGHNNPASANFTVGEIGFGPQWEDEPTLRELYDKACASIVRAECEIEELRAEVALLKQGMVMLAQERDEAMFSSNERGVVVSQVSGALVDAGCAVGDARKFGDLVRQLAQERDEARAAQ